MIRCLWPLGKCEEKAIHFYYMGEGFFLLNAWVGFPRCEEHRLPSDTPYTSVSEDEYVVMMIMDD